MIAISDHRNKSAKIQIKKKNMQQQFFTFDYKLSQNVGHSLK